MKKEFIPILFKKELRFRIDLWPHDLMKVEPGLGVSDANALHDLLSIALNIIK